MPKRKRARINLIGSPLSIVLGLIVLGIALLAIGVIYYISQVHIPMDPVLLGSITATSEQIIFVGAGLIMFGSICTLISLKLS